MQTEPLPKIIYNAIRTPDGTILASYYGHHYNTHTDGVTGKWYGVDGGTEYLRRIGVDEKCQELSVYSDAPFETIRQFFHWGRRNQETGEVTWIALKDISSGHLAALIDYMPETFKPTGGKFYQFMQKEVEYRREHNIFVPEYDS